ncbi:hypothetical protein ACNQGB_07465 [Flavobacterium sp. XS1P32]|uniref:hypothetical protein n=1 Tax=Flavobacterium sp. XS1P32 TaxID=3401726 RepID=UPI003AAEAA3A
MKEKNNQTPRSLVIEISVSHEGFVNLILAKLLGITPEGSKSFGTSSQALSFNAKANLLLDLKYLDKIEIEKFQIFMEIRNKFAHISDVDTFEKCFSLTTNYNRLKKLLNESEKGNNLEEKMKNMFLILAVQISNKLSEIALKSL